MSYPRMHDERVRAESFGGIAENYDRYRPSYPAALIDDLVGMGARDVLDVGCGTGKAGRLLVERGLNVLGVEVDAQMARVARGHGLGVEVGAFEAWDPAGRRFDLLVCGQAWHWIDPAVGVAKAASVLRPHGSVALFWNSSSLDGGTERQIRAVYQRLAPQLARPPAGERRRDPPFAGDLDASGLFEPSTTREYRWQQSYSARDWAEMVQTHSDHLVLDAATRAAVVAAIASVIRARGGEVSAEYRTHAVFARLGER